MRGNAYVQSRLLRNALDNAARHARSQIGATLRLESKAAGAAVAGTGMTVSFPRG